jgi:hypothetical protein
VIAPGLVPQVPDLQSIFSHSSWKEPIMAIFTAYDRRYALHSTTNCGNDKKVTEDFTTRANT